MAYSGKHISSSFDLALTSLQNDVLMMASLTERLFRNAVDGLVQRNTDICNRVVADDEEIDVLEKEVDRAGIDTLIRFHPVATDLRRVISQMKLSANLERVADQSVAIARRAKRLNAQPVCPEISWLDPILQHALAQFHDSLRAFVDQDTQLSLGLKPRDRELDAIISRTTEKLIAAMTLSPDRIHSLMDLIFVARSLERIGDHASSIGEDAFWIDRAEDIRHTFRKKEE